VLQAQSGLARTVAAGSDLTLTDLVDVLQPDYIRAHYPASCFRAFLETPESRRQPFLYDNMDLWDDFDATPWGSSADEAYYVARADAVASVSWLLRERFPGAASRAVIPNGIDREFLSVLRKAPKPRRKDRRILYMGGLGGSWFDWATTHQLTQELCDCEFVFIGGTGLPPEETDPAVQARIDEHVATLASRPNVEVVPEVDHDDLVPWLSGASVGLIPFIPNDLSAAVSPLKVFEYLAVGAITVQRGMPDIASYPGVLTAETSDSFVKLVRQASERPPDNALERAMDAFCDVSTWRERLADIEDLVLRGARSSVVGEIP
jgi:glycosyltransferase involved in cell wall biosynthesis